ncbi:hypothetical protein EX30DRAFT_94772 [Ascodesmis nigricans]|uniref:Small ribosomal subunit protein mS33 n=1 Tax=Ascodesmis nigricans TaxID=341454 RepID=A0A4S2N3Y9_9PEZI|nr:hypothetical protein EX30DRAFT_94772 [Ascodesmis nigricans]
MARDQVQPQHHRTSAPLPPTTTESQHRSPARRPFAVRPLFHLVRAAAGAVISVMSAPAKERLLQLYQASARVFNQNWNPTGARTGAKILRLRPLGPAVKDYYPARRVTLRDFRKAWPEWCFPDEDEYHRVLNVERTKARGKEEEVEGECSCRRESMNGWEEDGVGRDLLRRYWRSLYDTGNPGVETSCTDGSFGTGINSASLVWVFVTKAPGEITVRLLVLLVSLKGLYQIPPEISCQPLIER